MSPFVSDSSNTWEYPVLLTRKELVNGDLEKIVEDMVGAIAKKIRDLAKASPCENFQIITYGSAGFFYPAGPPEIEVKYE